MSVATVDDVAVELGRKPADDMESSQWQRWLDRAHRLILLRVPVLDDWCDTDPSYRAMVCDIEAAAVARKALNPNGVRSQMTQIDDANLQQTIDTSRAAGEVVILEVEWDLLMRQVTGDIETAIIQPDDPYAVHPPRVHGDW